MNSLASLYPWIKPAHVGLVTLSGTLFAVRGLAVLAQQPWPMRRAWRLLSYGIDTLLLTAGVLLWATLQLNPVHDSWLGAKLLLLLVYIVLGSLALSHHPLGALRLIAA